MTHHRHLSRTALMAAAARAAHLIVDDEPIIFSDSLAYRLLGDSADELVAYHRLHGDHLVLAGARAAVLTRSRYTEDILAKAVDRGVTQYVILGAGLDSFAYRSELARRLQVFEVDKPASQQFKRGRLAAAGIAVPRNVSFVPVDLEWTTLLAGLTEAGFDPASPAVVSWLGVTMYLTHEAIGHTMAILGELAPGTELIADYLLPPQLRDTTGQTYAELVAPNAAEHGEPWLSFFAPDDMSALLVEHGLRLVRHVPLGEALDAALWNRSDALRPYALPVLAHAAVDRTDHAPVG